MLSFTFQVKISKKYALVYCTLKYKSNILIKKKTKLAAIYLLQSLHLPEVYAQESVNKSFVRVRLYYLYLPMDVCTIFLHIFNNKFWLQFICNKLISTTAQESVKIISTKWFMHISHLISVSIFLENFDTFLLFDLLV